MKEKSKRQEIEDKLGFYYGKILEFDENEPEDCECIAYIKEQVSYYKKELFKAEEREFFSSANKIFGTE